MRILEEDGTCHSHRESLSLTWPPAALVRQRRRQGRRSVNVSCLCLLARRSPPPAPPHLRHSSARRPCLRLPGRVVAGRCETRGGSGPRCRPNAQREIPRGELRTACPAPPQRQASSQGGSPPQEVIRCRIVRENPEFCYCWTTFWSPQCNFSHFSYVFGLPRRSVFTLASAFWRRSQSRTGVERSAAVVVRATGLVSETPSRLEVRALVGTGVTRRRQSAPTSAVSNMWVIKKI